MIYLVLNDHGIEILVFLLLFLAFDIHEFHVDAFIPPDYSGAIG
jgi:hypothetical protein